MIKYFFLLFNLVGFLIFGLFQKEDVKVVINAPTEISAGQSFVAEVRITKGDISGLGRFVQELPVGLTAAYDETSVLANADFKFQYQKVKLMWFLLPADNEIVIKYNVYVDPSFSGEISLGGEFVYLKESQKETVAASSFTINVTEGDGTIAEIPTKENEEETATIPRANVVCTRETPYFASGDIIVNIEIEKGQGNNYAKIEERIPDGYTASSLENKDAIFITEDNIVKFTWMNLPIDNKFIVSYKLTPTSSSKTIPNIVGMFSFLENESNREVNINQSSFIPHPEMIASNVPKKSSQAEVPTKQLNNAESTEEIVEISNTNSTKEQTKNTNSYVETTKESSYNKTINPVGLKYRVQLAAGHKRIKVKRYFRKLKISESVDVEMHDGWHKYLVGSHSDYKDARNHRVRIWNSTPINDAFVSAYNNGTRITVQEALMIGNQKWVKKKKNVIFVFFTDDC